MSQDFSQSDYLKGLTNSYGERLKVLVVDDEHDNLELLYRTFRRHYQVYQASSGQAALDCLATHGEMAVIIADQRMPKMTGTEFLSRTVNDYPDTIRIVLTGYTDVEDLVDAINTGQVFRYLTKPWNAEELQETIAQATTVYQHVKQRTRALTQSLQKESLINTTLTAIHQSLDYTSTLQTVAAALGKAFEADYAVLQATEDTANSPMPRVTYGQASPSLPEDCETAPVPFFPEPVLQRFSQQDQTAHRLSISFSYRQTPLATILLYQFGETTAWNQDTLDLLSSIASQVGLAISQAKLHQRIQRQTDKMRSELEVARQIQSNLLHQSWPQRAGTIIQALCQPAQQVGGDFYEVFVHPQGDTWLAVGDVAGKGVPAALFMASAISILRRELAANQPPGPEVVMANLNRALMEDLVNNNCFITAALVRYTPATRTIVYANAGHIYPVLWSHRAVMDAAAAGQLPQVSPTYLDQRSVPLGIHADWRSSPGTLVMRVGDAVLLSSDGITEAATAPGTQRLLNQDGLWQLILQQTDGLHLPSLLEQVNQDSATREDDQTLLSLEVTA